MTRWTIALALVTALAGCARAQVGGQDAPAPVASDTGALLSMARVGRLPAGERDAWEAYLETSRRLDRVDQDSMRRELRAVGRERMTRAPDVRQSFAFRPEVMNDRWLASDSGRAFVAAVLTYQAPNGGWSKHVDFAKGPRASGQSYFSESDRWQYIATIDNGSTTEELRLLAAAHRATGDERPRASFVRGIDYLLAAQMPNGCWPQVFPLQGSYHDAVTFNDDAVVNVLELFRDAQRDDRAEGRLTTPALRARLGAAFDRGVSCLVRSQVVVNGRRTVWGQQHDPLTLRPVGARTYELVGLSGRESAAITRFLMGLREPSDSAVAAVHAAVDWFRANQIRGFDYHYIDGRVENASAAPLWARLTEIETGRPIFANRDGVKLYDWNQLTDRRQGYAWYGREPAGALREYERWAPRHPRTTGR